MWWMKSEKGFVGVTRRVFAADFWLTTVLFGSTTTRRMWEFLTWITNRCTFTRASGTESRGQHVEVGRRSTGPVNLSNHRTLLSMSRMLALWRTHPAIVIFMAGGSSLEGVPESIRSETQPGPHSNSNQRPETHQKWILNLWLLHRLEEIQGRSTPRVRQKLALSSTTTRTQLLPVGHNHVLHYRWSHSYSSSTRFEIRANGTKL